MHSSTNISQTRQAVRGARIAIQRDRPSLGCASRAGLDQKTVEICLAEMSVPTDRNQAKFHCAA